MKTIISMIAIIAVSAIAPQTWAYPGLPSYIDMNIGQDRTILPLKSIYDPDYKAEFTTLNGTTLRTTTTNYTAYQIDEDFILNRQMIGRTAINASTLYFDIGNTNYNIENVTLELPSKWIVPLERTSGVSYSLGQVPAGVYLVNVVLADDAENVAGYQGMISYGVRLTPEVRDMTESLIQQANDPKAPSGLFTSPKVETGL
jgi:hypothetical protein